jgi:hypothetical protein
VRVIIKQQEQLEPTKEAYTPNLMKPAKTTQEMTAVTTNSVQSKVLGRLKQELSFVSGYRNMDHA